MQAQRDLVRAPSPPLLESLNNLTEYQLGLVDAVLIGQINPWQHYGPRGSQARALFNEDPELLISGPAGTGKSRSGLEKLVYCVQRFRRSRALILRKTRESLTESALLTLERDVLGLNHPLVVDGPNRSNRRTYVFPNGSEIGVAGIRSSGRDQTQRIMSTDYDMIFVQEAVELTEGEWERLTTRLRSGAMPFQQLLGDTNPSYPNLWLKRRCDAGTTTLLNSRHEENPLLWDNERGEWTPFGVEYIARLDKLTGARKQRLRYGRWVQAEGVVYEEWDPAMHIVDPFEIPEEWLRYRAIDFGYTNPFVCLWGTVDGDGRLYVYREIYHTQRTVRAHAVTLREQEGWTNTIEILNEQTGEFEEVEVENPDRESIEATVCDHDAEDRATLREEGMPSVAARKAVSRGLEKVRERLAVAGDGRPRLYFFRGCLVEEDRELRESNEPLSAVQEFDSYIWSGAKKEVPVKERDHGMDALRYLVMYLDGRRRSKAYHGLV